MKMFATALGLMAICGLALAEDAPANKASSQKMDDHFASCLIMQNQNEIALAKTAEEKASDKEVKQFAQHLEQDHTKFMAQLAKFGGNEVRNRDTSRRDAKPETSATARTDAARTGDSNSHEQQHMQIKRELADECLASTQQELGQKKGKEFDECYVGIQIAAHMQMVTELKVLERHASPELAAVLKEGRNTAQKHLDEAKRIMKDLAKAESK